MLAIEITAIIFSLLSIFYLIKQSKYGWYFGLVGILCYMVIFYQQALYANFTLQFFFVGQSIISIYNWTKEDHKNEIKRLDGYDFIMKDIPSIAMLSVFSYVIVDYMTNKPTITESLIFAISVYATVLLMRRVLENWIFWILNNILLINLFYTNQMYLSVGLYAIYIIMDIIGYKDWKRILKKQ